MRIIWEMILGIRWIARWRARRRYRKGKEPFEQAEGANLLYVEKHLRKRSLRPQIW